VSIQEEKRKGGQETQHLCDDGVRHIGIHSITPLHGIRHRDIKQRGEGIRRVLQEGKREGKKGKSGESERRRRDNRDDIIQEP